MWSSMIFSRHFSIGFSLVYCPDNYQGYEQMPTLLLLHVKLYSNVPLTGICTSPDWTQDLLPVFTLVPAPLHFGLFGFFRGVKRNFIRGSEVYKLISSLGQEQTNYRYENTLGVSILTLPGSKEKDPFGKMNGFSLIRHNSNKLFVCLL